MMARDPSQALPITRTSTLNPNPSPNPNPNPNRNPHRVSSRLTIRRAFCGGDHGRERLELMTVMTRYDDRIRKTLQIRYIPARFFFLLAPHRLHYPLPPCFFHKSHAAFMQSHNGSSESLPRARPLCAQPSLRGSGKLFSRHSRLLCLAPIKLEKVEIGWDIGATNHLPFSPVTPGGWPQI